MVWQRNGHRRKNRTGERQAFQNARGGFEIALCIAARTAGHVGLIGHRHFAGIRRDDGFASCREDSNRNDDQSN
jgi:hypothetical protein